MEREGTRKEIEGGKEGEQQRGEREDRMFNERVTLGVNSERVREGRVKREL